MAAENLRCKECGTVYPLEALYVCERCFGPLEVSYDHGFTDDIAALRRRIQGGPQDVWRYADFLPLAGGPPGPSNHLASRAGLPDGWTPLISADRLAERLGLREVWVKNDAANPTHSFKDRVVAVASARARELGFGALACASTGNLGNAVAARAAASGMRSVVLYPRTVEPEKLLATAVYGGEMYAVRGSYDDCSRLVVELAGELDWAFVNVNLRAYYAEGSKTLAFEIAEQLGWETPDVVISPVASGSLFTKLWQGFEQFRRLGLVEGPSPRIYGGQAEGCAPVAHAFADERPVSPIRPNTIAHSLAIGAPADGDLATATARTSGGGIYAVPEDEIGANMSLLAATAGVFGETAAGVTVGALRAAAQSGALGPDDRVVVLVTGTGLKTPQVVDARAGIEIDADVDELLEHIGVTA